MFYFALGPEKDASSQDFVSKLVSKIIDNLQVEIGKIHVRFEDRVSDPLHPFSFGVTLGGITVVSTNQNWERGFIHETTGVMHKILELNSLGIYMETGHTSLLDISQEEFISKAAAFVGHFNFRKKKNK